MPVFKIHRLKDNPQQHFRWAPQATGASEVKPKDYQEAGQVEAPGVYEAWIQLRDQGSPLRIGDILESEDGRMSICKYVGFEEARWVAPEAKPEQPEPSNV